MLNMLLSSGTIGNPKDKEELILRAAVSKGVKHIAPFDSNHIITKKKQYRLP